MFSREDRAELETAIIRQRLALQTLREFHSERAFDAIVVRTIHDWIDSGMIGPVPWPDSPFFARWADEQGWCNVNGHISYKFLVEFARDAR